MAEPENPRLPVIGEFVRGCGELVSVEVIPPPPAPPPETDYIFKEISARAEVRLRKSGRVLDVLETHNDHYGKATSVESIIELAQKYARANEISAESDIEVVAIRIETHFRARPLNKEGFYARDFFAFRPLDRGSSWNVPPATEEVVWSSAREATKASQP